MAREERHGTGPPRDRTTLLIRNHFNKKCKNVPEYQSRVQTRIPLQRILSAVYFRHWRLDTEEGIYQIVNFCRTEGGIYLRKYDGSTTVPREERHGKGPPRDITTPFMQKAFVFGGRTWTGLGTKLTTGGFTTHLNPNREMLYQSRVQKMMLLHRIPPAVCFQHCRERNPGPCCPQTPAGGLSTWSARGSCNQ